MDLITLQKSFILSNTYNLVNVWELPGSNFRVNPEIPSDLVFKIPYYKEMPSTGEKGSGRKLDLWGLGLYIGPFFQPLFPDTLK